MRFITIFVLTDIFISAKAWSCVSPVGRVYSHENSDAVLRFKADVTSLPAVFDIRFYNGTTKARISYNSTNGIRPEALPGANITGDQAGNVVVTLNNVQEEDAGVYVLTSAGVSSQCNCLYILGIPSKPTIRLNQTPFEGENATFKCNSISKTIPKNHSLNLLYNWIIDGKINPNGDKFQYSIQKESLTMAHIVKDDKIINIRCSAMENSSLNYSSESDIFLLDVYYGPNEVRINVKSPYNLTEGETDKQIRCTSDCYPNCTFQWTHLDSSVSAEPGALLSLNPVNRSAAGNYKCIARNIAAGNARNYSKHADVLVIVNYPPKVSIRSSTENITEGQEMTLFCEGKGYPPKYEYIGLTQTVGTTDIPNNNSELNGTVRFSTIRFSTLKFQDTGTYTCILNNGIKNVKQQLNQYGAKEIIVEASPKILTDELRFVGSSQGLGKIEISFYSYPVLENVLFSRPDGKEISSNEYHVFQSIVRTSFYGRDVSINGSHLKYEIQDLKESDFGNYSLTLANKVGTTRTKVYLIAEGKPSSPTLFLYLSGKNTPSFLWKKNFNGGLIQTFIIQVSINGTNAWTNVTNILESDENYRVNGSFYSTAVYELKPGLYTARLISKNSKGESDIVELGKTFEVFRKADSKKSVAAIIGGTICAVVVLVLVVVFLIMIRRARSKAGRKSNFSKKSEDDNDQDEEESEVNTINPMYAPADEIQDNTYAQPIKKKKASPEKSILYSEVTKKHGNKGKQNSDSTGNPEHATSKSQNLANAEGLIYADLTFEDKKTGQQKTIFRNIDNMTEYVEVDFSKKADPLPDSDEENRMTNK